MQGILLTGKCRNKSDIIISITRAAYYFCYQNASHNSLLNELHYYCRPYQIMNNIDNENQNLTIEHLAFSFFKPLIFFSAVIIYL